MPTPEESRLNKENAGLKRQLLFGIAAAQTQSKSKMRREIEKARADGYKLGMDAAKKTTLTATKVRRPGDVVVPSVQPSVAIEIEYRRKITREIEDMHRAVLKLVKESYRDNEPRIVEMAQDDIPANSLQSLMRRLSREWLDRFEQASVSLANYFAQTTRRRTDQQLKSILEQGGLAVEFVMTPAQRDVIAGIVHENVSLIKSIPQRYLGQVEQSVMRSVQIGRDVGGLAKELQEHFDVEKKRAALIARDQNSKATSFLNRERRLHLGLTTAIWMHSHAGKTPRPTHLANDGNKFDIRKGWYDPHEEKWIQPGELINCRCTSKTVIPGFI